MLVKNKGKISLNNCIGVICYKKTCEGNLIEMYVFK